MERNEFDQMLPAQAFRVAAAAEPYSLRKQPAEMPVEAIGQGLEFRILFLREGTGQVGHHDITAISHHILQYPGKETRKRIMESQRKRAKGPDEPFHKSSPYLHRKISLRNLQI